MLQVPNKASGLLDITWVVFMVDINGNYYTNIKKEKKIEQVYRVYI